MNTITVEDLGLSKEQQEEFARGARIVFGPTEGLTEPETGEDVNQDELR